MLVALAFLSIPLVRHRYGSSAKAAAEAELQPWSSPDGRHSHSMVPGGLLVTSTTTRLISRTSFVIRVEMRDSTS
ncbi:hypothetical protein EJK15_39520 [Nonomuraea basaltis]|nr:hypothetical protein EJK15_39520 [Nonomuraea basaltis]